MVDQQILDYITQESINGVGVEQIKKSLLDVGWQESDINDALNKINSIHPVAITPIRETRNLSKKILVLVVAGILVISGSALGYFYYSKNKIVVLDPVILSPTPSQTPSATITPVDTLVGPTSTPRVTNETANSTANQQPLVIKSGDFSLTIVKEDINIVESYDGATWSDDSKNIYFSKFIDISLTEGAIGKVQQELFNRLESNNLENMPSAVDFQKPLYEKLLVFRYNIQTKKINLLSSIDLMPCGWPVSIDYSSSLVSNKLEFQGCDQISGYIDYVYALDLTNFQIQKTVSPPSTYLNNNDRVPGFFLTKNPSGEAKSRYLSHNRHGFIQIQAPRSGGDDEYDIKSGFTFAPQRIGIFYDNNATLKNPDELGWGGGGPSQAMLDEANQYQPQYFINPNLMQSPEEIALKKRLGI